MTTTYSTWIYDADVKTASDRWVIVDSTTNETQARELYNNLRKRTSVAVRVRLIEQARGESPRVIDLGYGLVGVKPSDG
jgi:hypothetical protein